MKGKTNNSSFSIYNTNMTDITALNFEHYKKKEYTSNCIGTNLLKQQEKLINDCIKGYKIISARIFNILRAMRI